MTLHPEKKCHSSVILICLLVFTGLSQTSVTIDVKNAKSIIAPEVFGVLMEKLGRQWTGPGNSSIFVGINSTIPNTDGIRKDVIEGFRECDVGAIEWPGTCAGNTYEWEKNKNTANDVGVDRFIQFCKLTGAEAIISLRPTVNDVSSNRAFVQYIIDSLHYPLKWANVGGDIWGGCGSNFTDGYIANTFPQNFAKLNELRNTETGSNLKIIAAAGAAQGRYNWISGYYDSIGSQMDAIEYSDYSYYRDNISSSNPTEADYWKIMNDVFIRGFHKHLFDSIIPPMKAADSSSRIKIAFDQWGNWLKPSVDDWMQDVTMMDAISAAGHLHQFIQNADIVGLTCMAQGVNVQQSLINISQTGIMVKTPVFYVFKLFKPHHSKGAKFCPITASSYERTNGNLPAVSVVATVENSYYVNISCINVDISSTRNITVKLTGAYDSYRVLSADIITGPQYSSKNEFGQPETVNIKPFPTTGFEINTIGGTGILQARLPAKSVVMFRLYENCSCKLTSTKIATEKMFSVRAGSDGTVRISSSEKTQTPATVNIYSADGKQMICNATWTIGTREFSIGNNLSKGAYLVKITGCNINFKKLVIITE